MKTTLVALFAASLVSAQQFGGVPECAQTCLQEALPKAGCDVDDTACACEPSTQARLRSIVAPCLLSECDSEELVQAQQAGAAQCEQQSGSATGTATRQDLGTTGTMSILPTDLIVPPSDSPMTPGGPSATTISSMVTPPAGGNGTTVTQTSTAGGADETGGSGGGNGDGSDGSDGNGDDDSGASSLPNAGLIVALLAAVMAI